MVQIRHFSPDAVSFRLARTQPAIGHTEWKKTILEETNQ